MAKEFIPLSVRINEATQKLKNAGYVVVNTENDKFAILAERKKIICNDYTQFLNMTLELTKNK